MLLYNIYFLINNVLFKSTSYVFKQFRGDGSYVNRK